MCMRRFTTSIGSAESRPFSAFQPTAAPPRSARSRAWRAGTAAARAGAGAREIDAQPLESAGVEARALLPFHVHVGVAQIGAEEDVPPIVVHPAPPVGAFSAVVDNGGGVDALNTVIPRDWSALALTSGS